MDGYATKNRVEGVLTSTFFSAAVIHIALVKVSLPWSVVRCVSQLSV